MIDTDPFVQWIDVPDDRPALPPVDEEVCGLKDFSSLGIPTDLHIGQGSGLLLGPDFYHHAAVDTFPAITLFPSSGQDASLSTSESTPPYASLFPPALSPDSSPTSVASTPWLRTPETDLSLPNVANFTPMGALWDIAETEEETCSTIHFIDQSGNSLEDMPSQIQDVRLEDIACTPQVVSDTSLPSVFAGTPSTALSNTPMFVVSPPPCALPSYQITAVPLEQTHRTSLTPGSPHTSQSLFGFSPATEVPLPGCPPSPSLSPLSIISFFSQSPDASPNLSPVFNCSPLSPARLPMPLSKSDEKVELTDSDSSIPNSMTLVKLRRKRNVDTLGEDPPSSKISRRSMTKSIDEEEWNPGSERVKRRRAVTTPIPNCPPDESPDYTARQDSEGHSGATHTTCRICGQRFTRASDYVRHIQNSASHPETRTMWPCPYCDSALGRKDALGRHIKTLHRGKPIFIPEGISVSQFPESRKGPFQQQLGQRKMPLRRQYRKDTRRYR